ncbi:hypothetical protein HZC53_04530 [Candidatus Uhrbacteria bacterium]|nr:hypothetical protein [Candidatus Uhrbacteria bacterium]
MLEKNNPVNPLGNAYAAMGLAFTVISIIALIVIVDVKTRAEIVTQSTGSAISTGLDGAVSASGTNDYLQVVNASTYSWSDGATWSVDIRAEPSVLTLKKGKKGTVTYTVTATKDQGPVTFGVEGMVCVKNNHTMPTEELVIKNEVQAQDRPEQSFYPYGKADVDTSEKPVLQPGEDYCYPYATSFEPELKLKYRDYSLTMISSKVPASEAPCPKPFVCTAAVEVPTDLNYPENIDPNQSSSIIVDSIPRDLADGDGTCDDGDWFCFNWPGHRYGEPEEHDRKCFKWRGHHYGTDNNEDKNSNGIFYRIQSVGREKNDNSKDENKCKELNKPSHTWQFTDSGTQVYTATYECGKDAGTQTNTVIIRGTDKKALAQVLVNCVK